jgi:uridine phosphorylase
MLYSERMDSDKLYHIGFGRSDLAPNPPTVALLSGDPDRAKLIANTYLKEVITLSEHRGLFSYLGTLDNGQRMLSATSGMGAPSLSIVVNELIQVGIKTIIRVGTCGSIQDHVKAGSVVISKAALCRQGAANDIAPLEYPSSADPFLTVALANCAKDLNVEHHVGITASVDTFYEGQERSGGANPHLMRANQGMILEYVNLNVLNFEMESGTLFKMADVYGFRAGCVCAVVAQRTENESIVLEQKDRAVQNAILVAVNTAAQFAGR